MTFSPSISPGTPKSEMYFLWLIVERLLVFGLFVCNLPHCALSVFEFFFVRFLLCSLLVTLNCYPSKKLFSGKNLFK